MLETPSKVSTPLFKLRPMEATDAPFVLNSWLRRYRDAISARLVTDRTYYSIQHAVILKILATPTLRATIVCSPEDANHIYAYCISEDLSSLVPDLVILHFIYTKGTFRRFGLAKALLADAIGGHKLVHYSHRSHLITHLDRNNAWVYNPCYIWGLL